MSEPAVSLSEVTFRSKCNEYQGVWIPSRYKIDGVIHILSQDEQEAVERSGTSSLIEYVTTPTIWPTEYHPVIPLMAKRPGRTTPGHSPVQFNTENSDSYKPRPLPRIHLANGCGRARYGLVTRVVSRRTFAGYYRHNDVLCMECVAVYIREKK